jgi:PAS domain S-box-containing protein
MPNPNKETTHAKEASLERLINRTPFILTRCGRDLRYHFVSKAYARLVGQQPADIAGKSIVEVMGKEGLKTILPHIEKVLRGETTEYEAEVQFQGVGIRTLHAIYTPDLDDQGTVVGWIASMIDITERKRGEQVAWQLAAIVESSDDAIISADLDGIILSWNRGAEQIYGYSAEDVVGKSITVLLAPDRPDEEAEILQRIQQGEAVEHLETVRRRKDGSLVDVSLTVSSLKDGAGRIIGVSKIARDITEHKRAENALRAKEAELENIINRTPFMLIRCSPDLRYRFVSPAYAEMLNRRPDEIVGKELVEIIGKEGFKGVLPHIQKVLRGERAEYEHEVDYEGVGKRYLHGLYTPDKDEQGRVVGWITSMLDVTERKRAESQRDLLLAEIDHRVKNTLATVVSIANQSFSKDRSLEESRHSFSDRIRALAQTHTRLAEASWSGASLGTIIRDEIAPYRGADNVRITGPDVVLNPKCAISLGLAIHELTTNAAKYGALSSTTGLVEICWQLSSSADEIRLNWAESGGPPVSPPKRTGFGRLLLERVLVSDLRGAVKLEFGREGLTCSIVLPVKQSEETPCPPN